MSLGSDIALHFNIFSSFDKWTQWKTDQLNYISIVLIKPWK